MRHFGELLSLHSERLYMTFVLLCVTVIVVIKLFSEINLLSEKIGKYS